VSRQPRLRLNFYSFGAIAYTDPNCDTNANGIADTNAVA
jgi:hypothetical protein